MSALGSISARASTIAVGWIGICSGAARAASLRRPAGTLVVVGHRIAGDPVALGRPVPEVQDSTALRAERALRVALPTDDGPARRTAEHCAARFHGARDDRGDRERMQLVAGWSLVAGCWSLVVSRSSLVARVGSLVGGCRSPFTAPCQSPLLASDQQPATSNQRPATAWTRR